MSHKFLTDEQLKRINDIIDNDPYLPKDMIKDPVIREVCISGIWLSEELQKLDCPISLANRIQFSTAKSAFGKDTWEIHKQVLEDYKNNKLPLDLETSKLN